MCPIAPGLLTLTHRDFRFVELLGKPASSAEFAPALAELAPIMSAIPRFVIDARGSVVSVEGLDALIARLQTALPHSSLEALRRTLENPAAMQALTNSAAERWQLWVQAWLGFEPRQIAPGDIVGPHRVKLSQSASGAD